MTSPFLFLVLLPYVVLKALASPFPSFALYPRDESTAAINATILDHAGNDITSSFKIMVYNEPKQVAAASNLTNRRRGAAILSRPINDCQVRDSIFADSFCLHEDGNPTGMQAYEISCYIPMDFHHPVTGDYYASVHSMHRRNGHCDEDEICVDGLGRSNGSNPFDDYNLPPGRGGSQYGEYAMASCVKTTYFTNMIANSGKEQEQREPLVSFEGMVASMALSKPDGTTSLEVDTFGMNAVDQAGNPVQSKKCRDCMDLKTDPFGPKTDGLIADATLLTTGAVAGILWLAVLSG